MIYIPHDASSEQVLEIIRAWIDLLAAEDYQAAFDAIGPDGLRGDWTPEFLRDDIKKYRSAEFYPGEVDFRMTDWRTARGGNPEAEPEVLWYADNDSGLVGAIAFELPLNGRWSSLTADFVIRKNDGQEGDILTLEDFTAWFEPDPEDAMADEEPSAP